MSKGLSRVFSNTTSSKASILQCSAFFIVQLSYPYTITGKTIALTRWTFVSKVMSLLFNMLSRLVCFSLSCIGEGNGNPLQYFGHLMWRVDSLEKTLMLGGIGGRRKWMTEDEMIGWHHGLDGRESEWTPGVGDGQGGLVCCSPWSHKKSDTTEQLNWLCNTKNLMYHFQ